MRDEVAEWDMRLLVVQVDAEHVVSFKRTILDFRIEALPGHSFGARRIAAIHITGTAFLWHQARRSSSHTRLDDRALNSRNFYSPRHRKLWIQALYKRRNGMDCESAGDPLRFS